MSRIPDIDYVIEPEDNQEKIAEAWIAEGRRQERERILTIIKLDLLTTEDIRTRLEALVYGGKEHVPKR